ncbi:MAG: ExbD/TolR family protein [Aquificaceae bacterium]|jgi:biopolymer transport protein ExbD|uniref:ExbD/TolR family protein n=1 Tax=Hydrogenobacter sp. Uz 6-8 TaxID=3384828 RepID=UPI000F231245|nr:MAG: biopolymer transporter ExbD [Aquificota bacterium]
MEDKEFSSINVIPLVDIMLVLLTIVLITATFVVQGSIPVNLPKASQKHEETLSSLEIVLTKDGRLFFEGREVSLRELESILRSLDPSTRISISGDSQASLQSLVSLLDLLKKHNLERVSIRTEVVR